MSSLFFYCLVGYLIGSLSPGYFFGRIIKGIDIKKFGNHNTGATNTYHLVGPVYGFITAIFDIFKSLAVYAAALKCGGLDPNLAILPGLAAVAGHNWPFYLQFKGGKGTAPLGGLMLAIVIFNQSWLGLLFIATAGFYIFAISNTLNQQWSLRKTIKLLALIIPLGFAEISSQIFIGITAALLLFFAAVDIVRFSSKKFNRWYLFQSSIAKGKETKRFSGYTLFLLSTFIILNFFPKAIAVVSIVFFILADLAGPVGAKLMFKKEITHNKTWGGAISIILICLAAGIFMKNLSSIPIGWNIILAGSLIVSALDEFSFLLDDNILVPIGTALILTAFFS